MRLLRRARSAVILARAEGRACCYVTAPMDAAFTLLLHYDKDLRACGAHECHVIPGRRGGNAVTVSFLLK